MKIKTFCRSALAKPSNNLYLLALFPHGEFIGSDDVNNTHADAEKDCVQQIKWVITVRNTLFTKY